MWDYGFQALYKALVTGASVRGLKGCKTLNKHPDPKNPVEGKEERDVVTFPGFVDCVYLEAPGELQLDNGLGDVITIKNTNWSDAVLWNPHLTMEACYKDFVCVENAKCTVPNSSWQSRGCSTLHPQGIHLAKAHFWGNKKLTSDWLHVIVENEAEED